MGENSVVGIGRGVFAVNDTTILENELSYPGTG